jgi:hypothetical protein
MPDEVAMIEHDWLRFGEWRGRDIEYRTRVYEHDNRRLLIHSANVGRVENMHGVDLLYHNQPDGQYLAREHFETVLKSPNALGPRGGRRITDQTAPRHPTTPPLLRSSLKAGSEALALARSSFVSKSGEASPIEGRPSWGRILVISLSAMGTDAHRMCLRSSDLYTR